MNILKEVICTSPYLVLEIISVQEGDGFITELNSECASFTNDLILRGNISIFSVTVKA